MYLEFSAHAMLERDTRALAPPPFRNLLEQTLPDPVPHHPLLSAPTHPRIRGKRIPVWECGFFVQGQSRGGLVCPAAGPSVPRRAHRERGRRAKDAEEVGEGRVEIEGRR